MLQQALSLSFPIFFLMLFSLLRPISTANSNIYVKCSQLYFTPSTAYESNLNSLFTSLVESASISNFNKFEISATPGAGDIVYGLFQCRGDLNSSNCSDCVTSSVSQLKTGCPMSTSGTIQLEACFVKYDNTPFFGVENKMEVLNKCGPSIGHNSDLQKRIDDAFAYLTSGFNGQYFRGGSFGSIQGVAQCVQDLSVSDCQDCLSQACAQLRSECGTSSWGNIYLGTCYIQYADNGNDNSDIANNNSGGGSSNNILQNVIAGLISFLSSILASIITSKLTVKFEVKEVKIEVKEANKKAEEAIEKSEEAKKEVKVTKKLAEEAKEISEEARYPFHPNNGAPMPNPCRPCSSCYCLFY